MMIRKRVWGYLSAIAILLILVRNLAPSRHRLDDGTISSGLLRPNIYRWGDHVELIVNKVESDLTQFPYAYYDLPFTCPPTAAKKPLHLSLDEIIRGDRKWQSDYKLEFGKDVTCETLCARKTTAESMQRARDLVENGYVVQWLIDDELPAATTFISTIDHKKYYASGFPLGFLDPETGKAYLNNHVMLVIRYNVINPERFTIVGFEVYPKSVSDYHCPGASKQYDQYEIIVPQDKEELTYIPFTYSVYWREEFKVDWSNRWNFFLNSGELSEASSSKFHWMTLANSLGIALLITFVVIVNLFKALRIGQNGNGDEFEFTFDDDENFDSIYAVAKEWLLQTNCSSFSLKLLILVTSVGVQFLFTVIGSLIISCSLNKLHNIRNSVLTMALLCFVAGAFMASFIGTWLNIDYSSGPLTSTAVHHDRFYAILCGSLLPGLVMLSTQILNGIIWAKDSTHALPFRTVVLFISIYFIICIPLSLLGGEVSCRVYRSHGHRLPLLSSLGFSSNLRKYKKTINSTSKGYYSIKRLREGLIFDLLCVSISGFFPFAIIYVELQYIYKSVWLEKTTFYYFYGFLLANIVLLCVVVCEVSFLGCYVMMKRNRKDKQAGQNDAWRWKCFLIGTGCAWYMELYTLYYTLHVLKITGFSSIFISVCYSAIFNIASGCAMGSLGYLTCCWFVNKVYDTKYGRD